MNVTVLSPLLWQERISIPLVGAFVHAGFPSPADDYLEGSIDLNKQLVRHPAATFAIRAVGDSMRGVGIFSGDTLIVDRSGDAVDGSIVIAITDGEFTVKRLRHMRGGVYLCPENDAFAPIPVTSADDQIWGVVLYSIHKPQ